MTQNFRQLKNRIRSIENTRKVTRAMEMVSAAKLARVKGPFYATKPYFANLERVLFNLISDIAPVSHPLLENRSEKNAIALMVISSDTGLCGIYNYNVIKLAREFADNLGKEKVIIIPVGKEAFSYFRKEGYRVENSYLGMRGRPSEKVITDITDTLTGIFSSRQCDEVYIAYTHFSPNLRHKSVIEKFLNIGYQAQDRQYYLSEPEKDAILDSMIAKYLYDKIRIILFDAFTAEHSARMLAMKLATDNADELINTLTLLKNKARQAAITKEVLEIAMSAEALKG